MRGARSIWYGEELPALVHKSGDFSAYNPGMVDRDKFTDVPNGLRHIFGDLLPREPIFHTPAFGKDFAAVMAPDYWEVGASGRRYSREFVLQMMGETPPVDAQSVDWATSEHGLRALSADTYLFTYTLRQHARVTRRATIWQQAPGGWRILYHQGTIVLVDEDDTAPDPAERANTDQST